MFNQTLGKQKLKGLFNQTLGKQEIKGNFNVISSKLSFNEENPALGFKDLNASSNNRWEFCQLLLNTQS